MKILVFSCDLATGVASAKQLESLGHDVVYVANKKRLNNTSIDQAILSYENINTDSTLEAVKKAAPDYIFSIIFDEKIPNRIIQCAKHHALNFHPATLPDVRSGDAWYWSVFLGTVHSAITVHKLTSSWDTGDIAYQHTIPLSNKETLGSYTSKALGEMPKVIGAIHRMMLEQAFNFTPQSEGKYYSKPRWKNIYIDWHYSAEHIDKMVRAGNPNFPALTFYIDKAVQINEVSLTKKTTNTLPGTITVSNQKLLIAASDCLIEIKILTIMGVGVYSGENAIELFGIESGQKFGDIKTIEFYKNIADNSFS